VLGTTTSQTRRKFDLTGEWARFINGEKWDVVHVPSSLRPAGSYTLKRTMWLPKLGSDRAFLCFAGIAYHCLATMNSHAAGEVGAYAPYELEVTALLQEGENRIEVTVFDLVPGPQGQGKGDIAIGVNPGWEAYGGIIRDVWVEFRPSAFLVNVGLGYEVNSDLSQVTCKASMECTSVAESSGEISFALYQGASEIGAATVKAAIGPGTRTIEVPFTFESPLLWSPASPHLYRLSAKLNSSQSVDEFTCRTGFRRFEIRGRQFLWNEQPLILHGLCRHDMWLDQGFTLTKEQMRQDMTSIKRLGANFVRLVHYPHHRYIIELAEEIGLLVTEEPGYWQVEFPSMPKSEIAAGLRILEGAIRRDWNSPAVFGWFLGNESRLTVDYLREGKALCNRLDPIKRPVSFANSTAKEKAKEQFDAANLDFYSQHLYDFQEEKFEATADFYGQGKPLVIDEWGWEDAGNGEIFWDRNFDHLLDTIQEGKIAGHAFWSWNDLRQYARIDWPTHDGILFSGVVTESREPYAELYMRLNRLFQHQREHPESAKMGHDVPDSNEPTVIPLRIPIVDRRGPAKPLDLQGVVDSDDAQQAWSSLERTMAAFWPKTKMAQDQWERTGKQLLFWRRQNIEIADVPFVFAVKNQFVRPLVVTKDVPQVNIPVAQECDRLYALGNVTFPSGYPLEGKIGDTVGTLEMHYQSGAVDRVPLRNGFEVAWSNLVSDATRIEPLAVHAPQALLFEKDPAREHYQLLLLSVPARGRITELRLRHENGPPLAVCAISTQSNSTANGARQ
jgi:beta-glucuronidase